MNLTPTDVGKKFETREGKIVKILNYSDDDDNQFPYVVSFVNSPGDGVFTVASNGRFWRGEISTYDLIRKLTKQKALKDELL